MIIVDYPSLQIGNTHQVIFCHFCNYRHKAPANAKLIKCNGLHRSRITRYLEVQPVSTRKQFYQEFAKLYPKKSNLVPIQYQGAIQNEAEN